MVLLQYVNTLAPDVLEHLVKSILLLIYIKQTEYLLIWLHGHEGWSRARWFTYDIRSNFYLPSIWVVNISRWTSQQWKRFKEESETVCRRSFTVPPAHYSASSCCCCYCCCCSGSPSFSSERRPWCASSTRSFFPLMSSSESALRAFSIRSWFSNCRKACPLPPCQMTRRGSTSRPLTSVLNVLTRRDLGRPPTNKAGCLPRLGRNL